MELHPEARKEKLDALKAEVDEIAAEIDKLQREKGNLIKESRSLEDRQVKNWKWIHEASKFSGVSVSKYSEQHCTFHFHPMWINTYEPTYSLTVDFKQNGYSIRECYLPESIKISDLDNKKPLDQLVGGISDLVVCFFNKQQQIKEVEDEFGEHPDRTVSYTADLLRVLIRLKVSEEAADSFMLNVEVSYKPNEILPYNVALSFDDGREMSERDREDFDAHGSFFYHQRLLLAIREAF